MSLYSSACEDTVTEEMVIYIHLSQTHRRPLDKILFPCGQENEISGLDGDQTFQ